MPCRDPPGYPGAWWHITNRGLTKRTVFENAHDVEQFLSLLEAIAGLGCAVSTAHGRVRAHERRCEGDEVYREAVTRLVDLIVLRSVPAPARAVISGG